MLPFNVSEFYLSIMPQKLCLFKVEKKNNEKHATKFLLNNLACYTRYTETIDFFISSCIHVSLPHDFKFLSLNRVHFSIPCFYIQPQNMLWPRVC